MLPSPQPLTSLTSSISLTTSSSSLPPSSQLLSLRSLATPQHYPQIIHRLFDKKLRSFLSLQTKEQVLHACQELLINKTIDYMNITNEMESNQLKNLNLINVSLVDKEKVIGELRKELKEERERGREAREEIERLGKQLETVRGELKEEKQKWMRQKDGYEGREKQKGREREKITGEWILIKSQLQRKNRELERELGQKITELRKMKEEMNIIKAQRQKETMEQKRKIKDMGLQHERGRQELLKDKKYLQDLLEVREDEARIKAIRKNKKELQFEIVVKWEKEVEKQKQKQKQKSLGKEKGKKVDQLTIRSRSKSTRSRRKTVTFQNQPFFPPTIKPSHISHSTQFPQPSFISIPTFNPSIQTQTTFLQPQSINLTPFQLQYKDFIEQKYKFQYHQKLSLQQLHLKSILRQQYLQCLRQAKQKLSSLKLISLSLLQCQSLKLSQLYQVHTLRPSRQQDIQLIFTLFQQIQTLKLKCFKANTSTDNAYIALQQYHSKLQHYKQSVPINVVGRDPPKIMKKKSLRLQIQMDRKSSIRNIKMSSTCENYGEKSYLVSQDSQYMTREVMITECGSDAMSPLGKGMGGLGKKKMSRPSTGAVGKLRRKSVL